MNTKKKPIRTKLIVSQTLPTVLILLAAVLVFNIGVNWFINSRIERQLNAVTEEEKAFRHEDMGGGPGGERPGFRPDDILGTQGEALEFLPDGRISGPAEQTEGLASRLYEAVRQEEGVRRVTVDGSEYAVTLSEDAETGRHILAYIDITAVSSVARLANILLILIMVAAALSAFLISRRLAGTIEKPVKQLAAFAGEIGSGNFEKRELEFREEEFDRLSQSMNRMAGELDEARHHQEVFFQNVSHELRTPLTSIRGNAEGIVYGITDPAESGRVILAESERLGGLIEDLLYISRMGKSVSAENAETLDIREALSTVVSEQRIAAEQKGTVFAFDFPEKPLEFPIREEDARQLFGNLVSNAVRYAKSLVTVRAYGDASSVTVEVADDGPGISPEDLPHVFERFYKGAGGNHGIGLSVAESIAKAYGGTIEAKNDSGAVFRAVLRMDSRENG